MKPTKVREPKKLSGDARIIDLLERLGATLLYLGTDLDQGTVAKKLHMKTARINAVLRGLKKPLLK